MEITLDIELDDMSLHTFVRPIWRYSEQDAKDCRCTDCLYGRQWGNKIEGTGRLYCEPDFLNDDDDDGAYSCSSHWPMLSQGKPAKLAVKETE